MCNCFEKDVIIHKIMDSDSAIAIFRRNENNKLELYTRTAKRETTTTFNYCPWCGEKYEVK